MDGDDAFLGDMNQPLEQHQTLFSLLSAMDPSSDDHLDGQRPADPPSFLMYLVEKQRQEMDQFLQLHNEQLRISLQQQRSQHNVTLLSSVKLIASDALRQKDDEIASAHVRLQNLQEALRSTIENRDEWRRVAEEKNAMVLLLQSTHKEIQEAGSSSRPAEAEGGASPHGAGQEAKNLVEATQASLICKCCGTCGACMLILPCQHFCACKPCEVRLAACPICNSAKKGAMEVLFR